MEKLEEELLGQREQQGKGLEAGKSRLSMRSWREATGWSM